MFLIFKYYNLYVEYYNYKNSTITFHKIILTRIRKNRRTYNINIDKKSFHTIDITIYIYMHHLFSI